MKVAAVQMDIQLGLVAENREAMIRQLNAAAEAGATLIVFPECALTGYCFDSLDEARRCAEAVPGDSVRHMIAACTAQRVYAVWGMLETFGEKLFNVTVLAGPQGLIGVYRKIHLPYLGVDRFTAFGDRTYAVNLVDDLRIGMSICYDAAFPEAARTLALQGADLIVLPTNWPPGAEQMAEYTVNTRAMENNVYFLAVNRVGEERGFRFIGNSRICDPSGRTLAQANGTSETTLYADIDPERARNKRIVRVPGKHIIDRMADRRPEMYESLVRRHDLPRPGR